MGKRRKARNKHLFTESISTRESTFDGVKHDNQFKVYGTSNKNSKRKRQKIHVKKLYEKGFAVVSDDLSASMNSLNISALDEFDTDAGKGEDLFTRDFIVIDEFNSTRQQSNAPNAKTASELFIPSRIQEVSGKENVERRVILSRPQGKTEVESNKSNNDKLKYLEKPLPLADSSNDLRSKVICLKNIRKQNLKNFEVHCETMLQEHYNKVISNSYGAKINERPTHDDLQDLNVSYLENMKAELEIALQKETLQEKYTLRKSYVPEPDMNESMEQYGKNYYAPKKAIKTRLRPIYIDGSNVAFSYTNGKYFSVTGLKICIDYFLKRGHEVHAFVPHFRKNKCSNPVLFEQLIKNGLIITTPSRYLNGRNLTPYDDRYIVKCAAVNKGVIVSCDNYRDLIRENSSLQPVIEERLLMPLWVNDMLIFPDDPLGRNGPSLEEFLRF